MSYVLRNVYLEISNSPLLHFYFNHVSFSQEIFTLNEYFIRTCEELAGYTTPAKNTHIHKNVRS